MRFSYELLTDCAFLLQGSEAEGGRAHVNDMSEASKRESGQPLSNAQQPDLDDSNLQLQNVEEDEDAGYGEEAEVAEGADEGCALAPISDKFFYKEMAKIKEKSKTTGSGTLPPKKSASAYIIF